MSRIYEHFSHDELQNMLEESLDRTSELQKLIPETLEWLLMLSNKTLTANPHLNDTIRKLRKLGKVS